MHLVYVVREFQWNILDDNDIAYQQVLHFAWYDDMQVGKELKHK